MGLDSIIWMIEGFDVMAAHLPGVWVADVAGVWCFDFMVFGAPIDSGAGGLGVEEKENQATIQILSG